MAETGNAGTAPKIGNQRSAISIQLSAFNHDPFNRSTFQLRHPSRSRHSSLITRHDPSAFSFEFGNQESKTSHSPFGDHDSSFPLHPLSLILHPFPPSPSTPQLLNRVNPRSTASSPFRLHPGVYAPRRAFRLQGFTLIELVVVILIIATLAALLMTGASRLFDNAKKVQAKNDLTEIITAVNAFYTEYGVYPPSSATDFTYDGTAGKTNNLLFDTLRAVTTTVNTRGIVFISPRYARGTTGTPKGGISQVAATLGQYMDPYGKPYIVRLDTSFDSTVANPYSANAGPTPLRFSVIAWSFGKDAASQTPGATPNKNSGLNIDDVLSWQ